MKSAARRLVGALACVALVYACSGTSDAGDEPGEGGEREPCYPNGTCDPGLTCLSDRCVSAPGGGAAGSSSEGGSGGRSQGGSSSGGTSTGGRGTAGNGNEGGEETGGTATGGSGNEGGEATGGSPAGRGGNGGATGASAGSGAGGVGGASAGMSGAGGVGGAGSGTGGRSGASGSGTGGFAGECRISPAELFPPVVPTGQAIGLTGAPSPIGAPARSFDGYLLQAPCLDTNCDVCWSAGWVYEGIATPCNDTFGIDAIQNFTVGGVPGAHYRVTLHFYGVVEPKAYGDAVTRVSGTTRPVNLDSGANPPPLAYAIGEPTPQQTFYGTYEVHVIDNTGAVACSYFLNSDTGEGHYTYVLNFQRTIDVIGGGRLRVRSRSTVPCQIIKNCFGGGTTGECTPTGCFGKTRQVDLSSANPPPTGLVQPGLGNDDSNSGQWIFIDVTNVTCGQSPLACGGT